MKACDDARATKATDARGLRVATTRRQRAGQPADGLSLGGALAIGMLCGSALALLLVWRQSRQRQEALRELLWTTGMIPEELLPVLPDAVPESADADEALVAQVREVIAHIATHPDLMSASAERGAITLRGTVPEDELKPLLRAVADIPGVQTVESLLIPQDEAAPRRPSPSDHMGELPEIP